MPARSILEKILLVLLFVGVAMFLGGSIIRAATAYDIFTPGTLIHKPFLTDEQINYSIRLYAITAFYTLFGYGATLVGILGVTIAHRKEFRRNGGFFMAAVLFYCCIPIEFYAAFYDIRLLQSVNALSFDTAINGKELQTLFAERLSPRMSSAGFITLLAYLTSVFLIVWRPLTSKKTTSK